MQARTNLHPGDMASGRLLNTALQTCCTGVTYCFLKALQFVNAKAYISRQLSLLARSKSERFSGSHVPRMLKGQTCCRTSCHANQNPPWAFQINTKPPASAHATAHSKIGDLFPVQNCAFWLARAAVVRLKGAFTAFSQQLS